MNEKDMIERYIYEVTKRVPQETREEIRLELQSLIEDMCAAEECSVEEALQKLGSPAEFAKRYRGDNSCLIGPEYYDNYIWVLKIALIGIGISTLISALVQGIVDAENYVDFFTVFFTQLFATLVNSIYSIVGIVTIIFAILERQKVKISLNHSKPWSPLSLPPVPHKRAIISRSDSVISIIFITVFTALLLFAPQLFGAFHYDGEKLRSIACIFNLEEWSTIAPLLFFCLLAGLVDEIIRLVTGCYCKPVMYSSIICNTLQIVGAAILLKVMPLWNTGFAAQIQEHAGINQFSTADILRYWGSDTFSTVLLAGICAISCIEISVSVYKTLKYS